MIALLLTDTGNGIAGPGEYAVDAPSGTLYRIEALNGPMIVDPLEPHRQRATGVAAEWADGAEPTCAAEVSS